MGEMKKIKIDKENYKLLLAFADCNMCVSRASKKVYLSGTAIYNRFQRIRENTGLDPLRFWDLVQLFECEVIE